MENVEYDLILMSLVVFVPSLFALVLMIPGLFGPGREEWMRRWSLLGTTVTLVLSLFMFISYYTDVVQAHTGDRDATLLNARVAEADARAQQAEAPRHRDWVTRHPWIERFNIDYYLGVDGISMALVLLTTVISFLAMLASWNIERYVRGYCILFLILETGMLGTFLALDFFLFYIFWEVMLLPMYFLIGVWGGPRREYAAIKFFLYTLLGSVFILIAMLGFYFTDVRDFVDQSVVRGRAERLSHERGIPTAPTDEQVRVNTFDIVLLQRVGRVASDYLKHPEQTTLEVSRKAGQPQAAVAQRLRQPFFGRGFQLTMFLLLFVGFAIKVPLFPFHTWLPDAHVEAPTPISMILAGVLLKMGGYGIIRIAYPICPWAAEELAAWITAFAVINIVYGAFAAMAQTDFKRLVAYSSVSHMGYVILGVAVWSTQRPQYWSWGMNGAMFQMIGHGITSAGMFFLVGVIYDRAHHRDLNNFRGLLEPMPLFSGISFVIFFAAMGLPGMCGFVGEFMVVLATWNYSKVASILAALTVVLTAAYVLWTLQRVFLGTNPAYRGYQDMSLREILCIVPLVVLAVALGVLPGLLLYWMEPSATGLVDQLARVVGG